MKKILFFLLFPFLSPAQNPDDSNLMDAYGIGANIHYGFLIAHRSSLAELQKEPLRAVELKISRQTAGTKKWQQAHNYPEVGIKYSYWDLGNKEELGYGQTLAPFIGFTSHKNKNLTFHYGFGIGVGYISKPFDSETNYKNIAIGTKLNCNIQLFSEWQLKLAEQLFFNAGIHFNHVSNGGAVMPNLGINVPTACIGLKQNFGKTEKIISDSARYFTKAWRNSVYVSGANKQIYPVFGPNYLVFTLSAARLKQLTLKSAAGMGLDIHYDPSLLVAIRSAENPDPPKTKAIRAGINLSYELLFSDFTMIFQSGAYFYNPRLNDKIYTRLGMRYEFYNQYFACLSLKTHFGKADFFEWGIGKRF